MLRVVCVLKFGGDYLPEHVSRLRDAVERHLPGAPFVCLTDVQVDCERVGLRYGWPGWWSKLELCRPDIVGDLLYMDLDSTIIGDLSDMAAVGRLTVLSDFYWPERMQSSVMFIPEAEKAAVWSAFTADPDRHMWECVTRERWGDQGFLNGIWGRKADRWQDVLPGQLCSWKVHVRRKQSARERGNGSIPAGARVVVFHGLPRPWELGRMGSEAA